MRCEQIPRWSSSAQWQRLQRLKIGKRVTAVKPRDSLTGSNMVRSFVGIRVCACVYVSLNLCACVFVSISSVSPITNHSLQIVVTPSTLYSVDSHCMPEWSNMKQTGVHLIFSINSLNWFLAGKWEFCGSVWGLNEFLCEWFELWLKKYYRQLKLNYADIKKYFAILS